MLPPRQHSPAYSLTHSLWRIRDPSIAPPVKGVTLSALGAAPQTQASRKRDRVPYSLTRAGGLHHSLMTYRERLASAHTLSQILPPASVRHSPPLGGDRQGCGPVHNLSGGVRSRAAREAAIVPSTSPTPPQDRDSPSPKGRALQPRASSHITPSSRLAHQRPRDPLGGRPPSNRCTVAPLT